MTIRSVCRAPLAALGLAICLASPAICQVATETPKTQKEENKKAAARIMPAVNAFLDSLSDEQKAMVMLDFDSSKRVGWHFIPKDTRKGLPIMDMESEQKTVAMKLLRASLSAAGYEKATKIMQLESVLFKLEGEGGANERNPEKYYFTVFGKPGNKDRWGLSIEGHHLSLNFVFRGNKVVDSTPQFFATNPAKLMADYGEGFEKGLRVLRAEEQLGFQLVKSLNGEQLKKAMLPGDAPDEIRGAGKPQPTAEMLDGISVGEFNDEQMALLKKLMKSYTSKMKPLVAKQRWELIEEAGMDKVRFTWAGAKRPGIGHYYVVQGPTFVIEFINVQPDAAGNPANHVHCVWRDMQGDFDLPIE